MKPTCKIQWVDDKGFSTPDQNPAVGDAIHTSQNGGVCTVRRFPICENHLKQMPKGVSINGSYSSWWEFVSYAEEEGEE